MQDEDGATTQEQPHRSRGGFRGSQMDGQFMILFNANHPKSQCCDPALIADTREAFQDFPKQTADR
jgi:hypothetical protein